MTPTFTPTRRRPRAVSRTVMGTAALLAASVALLSGCGSSAGTASSAPAQDAPMAAASAAGGAANEKAVSDSALGSGTGTAPLAEAAADQRQVIRNADVTIEVADLAPAATKVRAAATGMGGYVSAETTGYGADGNPVVTGSGVEGKQETRQAVKGQSVIVVRVPGKQLDAVITQVSSVGKELSRSASAQDVTGEVADLTSRTATAKASVDRIRTLLAQAKTVAEIVSIESELTRREADLEALQARLKAMSDLTQLATLTVTLQTPAASVAEPSNGFMAGLSAGWSALKTSARTLFIVVGALLPFALLGALVLGPLWMWWRRNNAAKGGPNAQPRNAQPHNTQPYDPRTQPGAYAYSGTPQPSAPSEAVDQVDNP